MTLAQGARELFLDSALAPKAAMCELLQAEVLLDLERPHDARRTIEHGTDPTDADSDDAQRHDDNQHLGMQVASDERQQCRQGADDQRQRQVATAVLTLVAFQFTAAAA